MHQTDLSGARAGERGRRKVARTRVDGTAGRSGATRPALGRANLRAWAHASSTSTSTPSSSRYADSDIPSCATSSCWSSAGAAISAAWSSPPPTARGASGSTPACRSRRRSACVPQATFFQGSFPDYRDASRAVRAVLQGFSPTVVMASLDEAYLDFAGTERLYPVSLLPVAEQLRDAVRANTGLDCSIGIGPNRMIAKLASDAAKPRGLMEVRAGWEEGFLAGLALRAMPGVGPKTAERWAELGLADVWQVQRMEEARARAADRPGSAGAQAAGARVRRHHAPRRPAAAFGEPGDDPLARPARPRPARGHLVAAHRPRRRPAPRRASGGPHGDAQAAPRRFPHRDTPPHASRWPRISTPSSTAPRATCSGRRSRRCGCGTAACGSSASRRPTWPRRRRPTCSSRPQRRRLRDLSAAVDQLREKYGFAAVTPGSALRAQRRRDATSLTAARGRYLRSLSSNRSPTEPSAAVTCPPRSRKVADRAAPSARAWTVLF